MIIRKLKVNKFLSLSNFVYIINFIFHIILCLCLLKRDYCYFLLTFLRTAWATSWGLMSTVALTPTVFSSDSLAGSNFRYSAWKRNVLLAVCLFNIDYSQSFFFLYFFKYYKILCPFFIKWDSSDSTKL